MGVEGRMTTTKVLGIVAKSVSSSTEYLNIRTEDGRSLSISQTHVMFVSDPYGNSKDVMAKDVNIGDRVMVQDGDRGSLRSSDRARHADGGRRPVFLLHQLRPPDR